MCELLDLLLEARFSTASDGKEEDKGLEENTSKTPERVELYKLDEEDAELAMFNVM